MLLKKLAVLILMISALIFSSDIESVIKDLENRTNRLDSKIDAVRGILEGKIADLSASIDEELSKVRSDVKDLNLKLNDLSETVLTLSDLMKRLSDSLNITYENQKNLLKTIETLKKKLDESYTLSRKAVLASNQALEMAKSSKEDSLSAVKISQTNRLLIYLALMISLSSLVLSVYIFSTTR